MINIVDADYVQAVWLGTVKPCGQNTDLIADLTAAIRRLKDTQILDALADTCRMDVAVERLPEPTCTCAENCVEVRPEDDLGQCPTLGPALAEVGRKMMIEACDSIRGWNEMVLNGGWVAAGVADDDHYSGAILIGQLDPLANRSD